MGAGQDFKQAMIEMDLLIKARSALDNFNEKVMLFLFFYHKSYNQPLLFYIFSHLI